MHITYGLYLSSATKKTTKMKLWQFMLQSVKQSNIHANNRFIKFEGMAVYTQLTSKEIETLLERYAIGTLSDFKGIESGIENTNYYLKTSEGSYILTIYEKRVNVEDLPFYLDLQSHLASQHIPCPLPVKDKHGEIIQRLKDKPAALVTFLSGSSTRNIQNHHMSELGNMLASLHLAAQPMASRGKPNSFSLPRWCDMAKELGNTPDRIKSHLTDEIQSQLEWLQSSWPRELPSGIIHADLFPDNVFFQGNKLSGVIDFYFACRDWLMYDIAIVLNAWCFEHEREFNLTKAKLFLSAYNSVRPITELEWQALPVLSSGAAMRFLLTRTHDWCNPVDGALVKPKDPLEYLHKLRFHHGVSSYKEYGV